MSLRPTLTRFALLLTALLPLAALAASPKAAPKGPAPVDGVDYVVIEGGQPYAPVKGKIEVVEVFGYTCPHCAHFEPLVAKWKSKLPADVAFVPLAAPMGGHWMPYARAFFAARSMGLVGKTHDAMFRALHVDGTLPLTQPTPEEIAGFYARYGADPRRFVAAMASPAIDEQIGHAREFMIRSGVEGTPTIVVNGKYRVLGSPAEVLRIVDHLVARERAAKRR
jgi:thiol:disulfide interchange protein DsbA